MTSRRSAILRCGAVALATWLPEPRAVLRESEDDDERWLRVANVPSLAYALVDGDHIVTQAIGVQRAGETERVTADTVYAAASLTKAVFAYVALGLVHDGVLSLDRPVREYLPLPTPDDPHAGAITARHLLSHSSGWQNWRNDADEALATAFVPGTQWRYSGEGYFFLQRVVEKFDGQEYEPPRPPARIRATRHDAVQHDRVGGVGAI